MRPARSPCTNTLLRIKGASSTGSPNRSALRTGQGSPIGAVHAIEPGRRVPIGAQLTPPALTSHVGPLGQPGAIDLAPSIEALGLIGHRSGTGPARGAPTGHRHTGLEQLDRGVPQFGVCR